MIANRGRGCSPLRPLEVAGDACRPIVAFLIIDWLCVTYRQNVVTTFSATPENRQQQIGFAVSVTFRMHDGYAVRISFGHATY